jgi:hypothetical protein
LKRKSCSDRPQLKRKGLALRSIIIISSALGYSASVATLSNFLTTKPNRTQNLPGAEDDGDGILEPAEDNADTSRAKKAEKNKVIDIADRVSTGMLV